MGHPNPSLGVWGGGLRIKPGSGVGVLKPTQSQNPETPRNPPKTQLQNHPTEGFGTVWVWFWSVFEIFGSVLGSVGFIKLEPTSGGSRGA